MVAILTLWQCAISKEHRIEWKVNWPTIVKISVDHILKWVFWILGFENEIENDKKENTYRFSGWSRKWNLPVVFKVMMTSSNENIFPRYWPFVWGIHRSPVNSLHKGRWRGALMFSLICAWIKGWVNHREAGDLRRHRVHYDVIVMFQSDRC